METSKLVLNHRVDPSVAESRACARFFSQRQAIEKVVKLAIVKRLSGLPKELQSWSNDLTNLPGKKLHNMCIQSLLLIEVAVYKALLCVA